MTRFTLSTAAIAAVLVWSPSARAQTVPPPAQTTQTVPPVPTIQAPTPAAPAPAPAAVDADDKTGGSIIVQRVLVKVNGEILTQTDLEKDQADAIEQKNHVSASPKDIQSDAALSKMLEDVTPDVIVKEIDDLLELQRAHELGYKMTDAKYQEILDGIKKDNHLDDAQFKKALADQGLTPETLHANLEREYLLHEVEQEDIMGQYPLTDEEARQYYAEHPQDFMTQPTVVLRELTILVPAQTRAGQTGFLASTDEAAKAKAEAAHTRLVNGESFAKVAADVSESGSKANGGLIGTINLADLSEALRTKIDALKPGQFTDPLRTQVGYQILELDSRAAATERPFDEVRDIVTQKIYDLRLGGETEKYLTKLRAQAIIEWKDAALKALYDKRIHELAATAGK